ncbi:MAG: hypothetical protein AB7J37_10485 [Candidatus Melainabacteria bacterium]
MMQVSPNMFFGARKPLAPMSEQERATVDLLNDLSRDPDAAGDFAYSAIQAAGRQASRPPSHDRARFGTEDSLVSRHLQTVHGVGQFLARNSSIHDAPELLGDAVTAALALDDRGRVLDLAA